MRSLLLVRHKTCKHPALYVINPAKRSATQLRKASNLQCETRKNVAASNNAAPPRTSDAIVIGDGWWLLAAGRWQVWLDSLRDSLQSGHGMCAGHAFPDWGLHLRSFSCLATRREHFPLTSLLSPVRHQVAFSSAALSLLIYASAALRPLAKPASLPHSFLLFALSASATAKQALGKHLPANTQPHNSAPFVAIARDQQLIICP